MFHFLTSAEDQAVYLRKLRSALEPAGYAIIATFAEDGPTTCSGLPVERYSADRLTAALGDGFVVRDAARHEHTTPAGTIQPFTWLTVQRSPESKLTHYR